MTRRFSVVLMGAVVVLFLALPAFAQTTAVIQFLNADGDDTYGPTGPEGPDGQMETADAGIYSGTIGHTAVDIICDDAIHNIGANDYWQATALSPGSASTYFHPSNINNPDLVAGAYTNSPVPSSISQAQMYDMLGWLVTQILSNTTTTAQKAALNGAMWSITDDGWNDGSGNEAAAYTGGGSANHPVTDSAQYYVEQAATEVFTDNWVPTGLTVWTPTDNCQGISSPNGQGSCIDGGDKGAQEMWSTPEPGASLLLAVGGLALALGSLVSKKFLA